MRYGQKNDLDVKDVYNAVEADNSKCLADTLEEWVYILYHLHKNCLHVGSNSRFDWTPTSLISEHGSKKLQLVNLKKT